MIHDLTDTQCDWTTQFCGIETRPQGPPAPVGGVPHSSGAPPSDTPAQSADDADADLKANWTGLAGPTWAQNKEARAKTKRLGQLVSTARANVQDNPDLKIVNPMKDPSGKVIEPGGFLYKGKPPVTPPGMTDDPDPKRSEINAAIWNELANREGGGSSINAWDTAGITVGAGFAAKDNGGLPPVLEDFLKNDPEAAKALGEIGFSCLGGTFYAVNPDTGEVVKGYRAIDMIAKDKKALSRVIAVLENPDHAKNFAQAEWNFLKGKAAAVPDDVLKSWPRDNIILAAHFVHGTSLGWGVWQRIGPNVAALLRRCAMRVAVQMDKGASLVPAVHMPMLLESGNRIGRSAVSGPASLAGDAGAASSTGQIYIDDGSGKYYHLNG
jgi:hypothetical protein